MILFGHRGAKGEAPENTVAGFAYARNLEIDAFELDIRLSADERLVVMHDATVDRTTDGTGPVSAYTAAELARLDARADFPQWPERIGVPALDEILEAIPDVRVWEWEIKTDAPERLERICRQIGPLIERFGLRGRVTVSSFDPIALELIAAAAPDLPRGFIGAFDTPAYLETALRLGCAQVDIPLKSGSADMVRAAHDEGLRVTGWQGNTPEDVRTLHAWRVDHITTDFPMVAMATLREVS
jgi:glycerophosphoryl diester phosphodiesterase